MWEGETPHTHTLASPAQRTEFVPADDTGMKKVDETEKRRSPLSLTANLMLLSHPAAPPTAGAEVMSFEDMKALGSEAAVQAAGKYRQEGKAYEVQDGDIIHW